MKLSELHRLVILLYDPDQPDRDSEVVIQVRPPFTTVGGTPSVPVKNVYNGFDWDNGKFFLIPENTLVNADVDFEEKFKKMQTDYGWAVYENRNLKAENKKLRKQLDEK